MPYNQASLIVYNPNKFLIAYEFGETTVNKIPFPWTWHPSLGRGEGGQKSWRVHPNHSATMLSLTLSLVLSDSTTLTQHANLDTMHFIWLQLAIYSLSKEVLIDNFARTR